MVTLEASSTKPKKRRNPRKETRLKSHKRKEKSQNLHQTDEALKVLKTPQDSEASLYTELLGNCKVFLIKNPNETDSSRLLQILQNLKYWNPYHLHPRPHVVMCKKNWIRTAPIHVHDNQR
jgi:hypothetical protein